MSDNKREIEDRDKSGEQEKSGTQSASAADSDLSESKSRGGHARRNSIILALLLLGVFIAGWMIQHIHHGSEGPVAVIQKGGEIIERLDLDKDTSLVVGDLEGDYNIVKVEDGRIFVEEANCPDQICRYIGPISTEEEVIACLPHEMIIFIDEDNEE